MNSLKIPLKRMPNVKPGDLFAGLQELSLTQTIVYYLVDSNVRSSVQIRSWLKEAVKTIDVKEVCPQLVGAPVDDATAKAALRFVHQNITYTGDTVLWNRSEKWQTPAETWASKKGDCEDGAVLLLAILYQLGFSDEQCYLVAGDVVGGGHAYVAYTSFEDALDYPLDWCYWYDGSRRMSTPLIVDPHYFFGSGEWWRVNRKGSFVSKR